MEISAARGDTLFLAGEGPRTFSSLAAECDCFVADLGKTSCQAVTVGEASKIFCRWFLSASALADHDDPAHPRWPPEWLSELGQRSLHRQRSLSPNDEVTNIASLIRSASAIRDWCAGRLLRTGQETEWLLADLREILKSDPAMTLSIVAARLVEKRGVGVRRETLIKALDHLRLSGEYNGPRRKRKRALS